MLTISMIHSETADVLSVEDNGIGVKKYDLPYIFQKGFTGDSTDSRKKATGIGLYLVKKMADDLILRLEAASQWEKGFKIVIFFPKLRSPAGFSPAGSVLSAIQRLVFCYSFQIGFGIAIQYQVSICYRVIVDQIIQL